jgi:hypothetical protein
VADPFWTVERVGLASFVVVGADRRDAPHPSYFGSRHDAQQRALDLNLAIDRGDENDPRSLTTPDQKHPSPTEGDRSLMQAQHTITVYDGNRLDRTREAAPQQLATEFIKAVRDGYFERPCGRGREFAYRLWLTDPNGADIAWDDADDMVLMESMQSMLAANDEALKMVQRAVWGDG